MAVYRVQKTRDYTVMANHHLRNKGLSLKAKGLLSLIFSLPDDWNYTTRGLSTICKEGVDSIGAALNELESAGYIVRNRLRDQKGRIKDTEYLIYEQPVENVDAPRIEAEVANVESQDTDKSSANGSNQNEPNLPAPYTDTPNTDAPSTASPCTENPDTDNPAQLNTYIPRIYRARTDEQNIHQSIVNTKQAALPDSREIDRCRAEVEFQIEYYALVENKAFNHKQLDEIVDLIVDVLCTTKPVINLGGDEYSTEVVKSRFKKLNCGHIDNLMVNLQHTTTRIHNIRGYILKALYNATFTTESQNCADVNYQYFGGGKLWP